LEGRAQKILFVPKLHLAAARLFTGGGFTLFTAFAGLLVKLTFLHFRDQARVLDDLLEALERVLDGFVFFQSYFDHCGHSPLYGWNRCA